MGGGGDELKGPDLKEGVAASELKEGRGLAGHFDGDAVLLVRRGDVIHAIGAKCTHYGGPLDEGVVAGDTVRCPWHHACFSLRTGEALLAPALADLATFETEARDGRVRVVAKREAPEPLAKGAERRERDPAASPASVVIIGAGAAGNAAAEALRREGYAGPVTLVDPDEDAPCDRPNLSKDYLQGEAPEAWIPLHPPTFYAANGLRLRRARATKLDPTKHLVTLDDGSTLTYGALILAPGAEPVRLDLPVADGARVFTLRTLADSRAIIAAAEAAKRAVILGASFIGLEVAASLRHRDLEVHVVAPEQLPLARVLGEDLGRFVHALHTEKGVRFHLGRTAQRIAEGHVELDDGARIDADFVVMGVGVRPRTELAKAAGLDVDDGIVVDDRLRTSAEDVWAAGDGARFPDPRTGEPIRIEHWVVAERMGAAAARSVLGVTDAFSDVPFFWSQHYDAVIAYVGHAREWDEARLDGDPKERDCAVRYTRGGELLALATIFRDELSLTTEIEMERAIRGRRTAR